MPLVKALAEGNVIQEIGPISKLWIDVISPSFQGAPENYRIKPPEPSRLWVNTYVTGFLEAFKTKEAAEQEASKWDNVTKTAVEFVEVLP